MLKKILLLSGLFVLAMEAYSQQKDSVSYLNSGNLSFLESLKKLKITGLLQTQYQRYESGYSGLNNRLNIRRARLKFAYASGIAQYVLQFHATERNMGPDEVYIAITDPWTKTLTLTGGIFNRPFGNEIAYSSTFLESDERARITRTLFPDEKDLGFMISFHPRQSSPFNFLWIDAGIFNGTGPMKEDFDDRKNFIGHVYSRRTFMGDNIEMGLGLSWYKGGFSNQRGFHYEWENGFVAIPNDSLALSSQALKGVDAQLSFKWVLGKTRLRFEYINGEQAGTFENSRTPNTAPADKKGVALPSYLRNCEGGYLIFIHDLHKNNLGFVFKYDWYDPNTNLRGSEIGSLSNTGPTDMLYQTFGMGLNYQLDKNIRLMAYYNFVNNEKTSLPEYSADLPDNHLTLRLQYGF